MNIYLCLIPFLLAGAAYSQEPNLQERAMVERAMAKAMERAIAKAIKEMETQTTKEKMNNKVYPRRLVVGANPSDEIKTYLDPIVAKIQRIGNLNYPEEARGKVHGTTIIEVHIGAKGTLDEVKIVNSSGHTVLDQAAVQSIRISAPFAAFPPEIMRRADILVFVWHFNFINDEGMAQMRSNPSVNTDAAR